MTSYGGILVKAMILLQLGTLGVCQRSCCYFLASLHMPPCVKGLVGQWGQSGQKIQVKSNVRVHFSSTLTQLLFIQLEFPRGYLGGLLYR